MKLFPNLARLVLAGFILSTLHAQEAEIPDSIVTVGATKLDPAGQPMGYISLTSPQPQTLRGRQFGVWIKPAAALVDGQFTFQGTIQPVLTAAAASAMLDRAVRLGQSRTDIEDTIRYLYRKAKYPDYLSKLNDPRQPADPPRPDDPPLPDEPPSAEQAAIIASRGQIDSAISDDLDLAALVSPGLALIHGRAWAGALPAQGQNVTIEIRLRENGVDGAVVGRVELKSGVPIVLPAPGAPVQVPNASNSGDLVIGLRWSCPADLRRLSLLNPSFKLYRADPEFAIQSGMVETPPDAAILIGLTALPNPQVIQVGTGSILPAKIFTAADVNDFSPGPDDSAPITFITDRNEACCGQEDSEPFEDGDEFYYFAVACDILGQPGFVSKGGLGRACTRVVPFTPGDLQISIDPLASTPAISISWDTVPGAKTRPTRFEILRGVGALGTRPDGSLIPNPKASPAAKINSGMNLDKNDPAMLTPCGSVNAPVPNVDETPVRMSWTDPSPFILPGESCWYSVRAVFDGACETLYSDAAAPVYANLRKRDAPAPAMLCYQGNDFPFAAVKYVKSSDVTFDYPAVEYRASLVCNRENIGVSHVSFEIKDGNGTSLWQQTSYFPDQAQPNSALEVPVLIERLDTIPARTTVTCIAYSNTGAASQPATAGFRFPAAGQATSIKTTLPGLVFVAGAFSLSSLPPTTSQLRTVVVGGTAVTGTATLPDPVAGLTPDGNRLATATLNLGSLPTPPVGSDPNPSVLLEKPVPGGGWTSLGGARVNQGKVVVPGGYAGPIRAIPLKIYSPSGCSGMVHSTGDGSIAPVSLGLCLGPDTKEYRIYREISIPGSTTGSDLRLISQGPARAADGVLALADGKLPAVSARVQYYAQLIDGNGNASEMTPLLSCPLTLVSRPPVPVLNRVSAATNSDLGVEWYCPAPGVERFQIFVEAGRTRFDTQAIDLPPQLRNLLPQPVAASLALPNGLTDVPVVGNISHNFSASSISSQVKRLSRNTSSYYTPRVGEDANSLGIGPEFLQKIAVNPAGKFKVWVKAVGPTGGVSAPSNVLEFTWSNPRRASTIPDAPVPWPSRDLPPSGSGAAFDPPVEVMNIPSLTVNSDDEPYYYVSTFSPDNAGEKYLRGVRIGAILSAGDKDFSYNGQSKRLTITANQKLAGKHDPNAYLSRLSANPSETILPAVLYRRQVPSSEFPEPSGDVIQVSPLITHIARYVQGNASTIVDPYVAVISFTIPDGPGAASLEFCILDTQPVIEGAAYQYFLVSFDDQGEMRHAVDAGTTTIDP